MMRIPLHKIKVGISTDNSLVCLQYLKSICIRIIFGINGNGVIAVDLCPPFNAGDDGRPAGYRGRFLTPPGKAAADDAFMDEPVPLLQFPFGKPLGHSRRGSCPAGTPVDSLVSIKHGITCRGPGIYRLSRPQYMRATVNSRVFRMHELVGLIDPLAHYSTPTNQLVSSVILQSFKIFLEVDNSVEIAPIGYIHR